jgi:archaeal chaperonin
MSEPQQIYILPEDTKRETGKDAQRNNIMAAKAVAQTVRTTLGPKGMDKMLVDSAGNVTVTNDGVTILNEMHIEHPAAKMVVEVAKTQETAVGDGTTTAVIIAGELLTKAELLLDQKIHPTVLAKGYRLAEAEAQRILRSLALPVSSQDTQLLQNIAMTAMTGKGTEVRKGPLAELVVKALQRNIELDDIKVEYVVGEGTHQLIEGIVLDKERVHPEMPTSVEHASIVLLNSPLEIRNTEIDAKIQITDPSQLNQYLEQEEKSLREMVDKIASTGARVVCSQKGIDELAQHFLSKMGIMAFRRIKKSDMERLARATGGKIVNNWKEITPSDLGKAGMVRQLKIVEEEMIFIEQCPNPKSVTLLLNGSTEHVAEEIKRAVTDALGDVSSAIKDGKIVAGAGSVEMEVAKGLRVYARTLSGREQLAVEAYAETLEMIPRTLAENGGLDPIDVITQLRSAHSEKSWIGIDVFTGKMIDAWSAGILEPLKVKTQALTSATDVAEMILRIDDVILAGKE